MSSIIGIRDDRPLADRRPPDLLLTLRCAAVVFFFAGRGMVWSQGSSADSYSSATVGFFFCLALLAIPRMLELRSLRWPPFGFYLVLLVLWFCIAYLLTFGRNPVYDPKSLMVEFAGAVVLTVLIYFNFQTVRELQGLMASIVIAGLIVSVIGVQYYVTTGGNGLRFAAFGTGATYNMVSYMLAGAAMAGPVTSSMMKRGKQTLAAPYRLAMFGFLVFGILLTGTRGGVLAIGVAIITNYMVLNQSQFKKVSQTVLAVAAFLACSYALSHTGVVNRIFDTGEYVSITEYAGYARGEMFLHALGRVFSDSSAPWFGIGVGQYRIQTPSGVGDYPHNLFLDLAVNAGIPAAILKGMLLWYILRSLVRMCRDRRHPQLRYLAAQMLGVTVVGIIAGLICFQFTANLQLWILIGAWGSLEARRRDANRVQPVRRELPGQIRKTGEMGESSSPLGPGRHRNLSQGKRRKMLA